MGPWRSCQRTCPLWWAPLVLERGGTGVGRLRGACGWREVGAPGGLPGEHVAHNVVRGGRPGTVVHRVGWAGAGGRPARAFHKYCEFSHFQVRIRYVARAWLRYGPTSMDSLLRACSRAGALLWRVVADPSLVICSASYLDRGRPDWLDVPHCIQYP